MHNTTTEAVVDFIWSASSQIFDMNPYWANYNRKPISASPHLKAAIVKLPCGGNFARNCHSAITCAEGSSGTNCPQNQGTL